MGCTQQKQKRSNNSKNTFKTNDENNNNNMQSNNNTNCDKNNYLDNTEINNNHNNSKSEHITQVVEEKKTVAKFPVRAQIPSLDNKKVVILNDHTLKQTVQVPVLESVGRSTIFRQRSNSFQKIGNNTHSPLNHQNHNHITSSTFSQQIDILKIGQIAVAA